MITTVSSSQSLLAALSVARAGDTILLAPGEYSLVKILNTKFAGDVTIASADAANPALIHGLKVDYSEGLTFRNLKIQTDAGNNYNAAYVGGSKDIHFEAVELFGSKVGDGSGFSVRDSTDVSVVNSDLHHLWGGINHLNSQQLLFAGNKLHDLQSEGIRGGGSSYVTISGNHLTNFFPLSGDHPDAIQFWTANTTASVRDIVITDNIFVRGAGAPVQGIFVGNESKLPFLNLTVTGNAIIGGMWHGISIDYTDNANVSDNIVQAYTDIGSWLGVYHATNSSSANNQATQYKFETNSNFSQTGNKRIAPKRPRD